LAKVSRNGFKGYIDNTGKEVIPLIYDYALDFSDGLAKVRNDGYSYSYKWGCIDKTGKEVISLIYTDISHFSDGLAWVLNDGYKWGCIDKTGKEVIPFIYDEAGGFSEGLAAVRKDNRWGFIDKAGKEVIPCIYDEVYIDYNKAGGFSDDLARVRKDGEWGYIDKTGKEVIFFPENLAFLDGLASATWDNQKGFIDKEGYFIGKGFVKSASELKNEIQEKARLENEKKEKTKLEKEKKDAIKREKDAAEQEKNRSQSERKKTYNSINGKTFEASYTEQQYLSILRTVLKLTFNPTNEEEGTVVLESIREVSSAATPGSTQRDSNRLTYYIKEDGKIIVGSMTLERKQSGYGVRLVSDVKDNNGNNITFR
jgi:hypothetical protein